MNNTMVCLPKIELTKENAVGFIRGSSKQGECYGEADITPEVASILMTLEVRNRKRTLANITNFARYMNTEKWFRTPVPIIFDTKGHLIDGAHRLLSIIESGRPMVFVVCCGASLKAQKVVDNGKPRTITDNMRVDGFDAITPLHAAIMRSVMTESPASLRVAVPKLDLEDLLCQYFQPINEVIEAFKMGGKDRIRESSAMSPVVRAKMIYKDNPKKIAAINRFVRVLNAVGLTSDEAYLKQIATRKGEDRIAESLKQWLNQNLHSSKTRLLKRVIYRTTSKALWAYLHGEKYENLSEAKTEYFPLEVNKHHVVYFDNERVMEKKHGSKRNTVKKMAKRNIMEKMIEA